MTDGQKPVVYKELNATNRCSKLIKPCIDILIPSVYLFDIMDNTLTFCRQGGY